MVIALPYLQGKEVDLGASPRSGTTRLRPETGAEFYSPSAKARLKEISLACAVSFHAGRVCV